MHDIICHFYDLQSYCQWPLTKECTRICAVIVKKLKFKENCTTTRNVSQLWHNDRILSWCAAFNNMVFRLVRWCYESSLWFSWMLWTVVELCSLFLSGWRNWLGRKNRGALLSWNQWKEKQPWCCLMLR